MSNDNKQKSVKYILTILLFTIAIVGVTFSIILSLWKDVNLWHSIATFSLSALSGLIVLMHGISLLNKDDFDIFTSSFRLLSIFQIAFLIVAFSSLVFTLI